MTQDMKIEFHEYEDDVYNGDRATSKVKRSRFIVLLNGIEIQEFSGYDPLWQTYESSERTRARAEEFLIKFCKSAKVAADDVIRKRFVPEITTEYIEV